MRLLLDESVPAKLRRSLSSHEVRTVVEMGWSGVRNGKLLALAASQFDAFITVDKNLPYQQNYLVPALDSNGKVTWKCKAAPEVRRIVPVSCREE